MKTMRRACCAVIALAISFGIGLAKAEGPSQAQLDAMRQALQKYQDPYVAVRDLYLSTVGCVHYSG